jgi:formylglycine-generating enzyme required for sulfatase activity
MTDGASRNDPSYGLTPFSDRVIRGGNWISFARFCRSANRGYGYPDNLGYGPGFRVVLAPGQP